MIKTSQTFSICYLVFIILLVLVELPSLLVPQESAAQRAVLPVPAPEPLVPA